MAKGDHSYRRKPKGAKGGGYRRPRVQIGFEKDMIASISRLAKFNKRSFAAEVRELVSFALGSINGPVDLTKIIGGPPVSQVERN